MFKYVLASLIVGAGAGFIPTYLQLRDARMQLTATEERLNTELATARESVLVSHVHSLLGLVIVHVRQGEYDKARELSTQLFDETDKALLVVSDADAKRRLQTLAQTRDQVTGALALNDPKVLEPLDRLFLLLGESL